MKTLIKLIVLFLFAQQSFAQISITQADFPKAGDWYRYSRAMNILTFKAAPTGTNYLWDFTNLKHLNQYVDTFISMNNAPAAYKFVFSNFMDPDKATIAQPAGLLTDSFASVPLKDMIHFYKLNSSEYMYLGFGASIYGMQIPMKYDNPDLVYKLPMQYGNSFSDASFLQTPSILSSILYYSSEKNRSVDVDGWGTVKTPFGSFQCIRVKTVLQQKDSVYFDSIGNGFAINQPTKVFYEWFGKSTGMPLLKATAQVMGNDTIVSQVVYQDSLRSEPDTTPSFVEQHQQLANIEVFPNPFIKEVNIMLSLDQDSWIKIEVLDMKGSVVASRNGKTYAEGTHHFSFGTTELKAKGVYFIKLKSPSGNYIYPVIKN